MIVHRVIVLLSIRKVFTVNFKIIYFSCGSTSNDIIIADNIYFLLIITEIQCVTFHCNFRPKFQ